MKRKASKNGPGRAPSRATALFAWPLMLLGVLEALLTLDFYRCTACSHTLPKRAVIAFIAYSLIAGIGGIAAGRGLMRLSERARLFAVALCGTNIAVGIFFMFYGGKDLRSYVYAAVDATVAASGTIADPLVVYNITLWTVRALLAAAIALRVACIVHFSKPGIKHLFSQGGNHG